MFFCFNNSIMIINKIKKFLWFIIIFDGILIIGDSMKRVLQLIIICILFIPLLVNAETCDNNKVSISSITVDDKSTNVEELNEANVEEKDVNLNLNMSNVGDNIKYRIIIKNDSNDDYLLNKNSIKVSSDYIDYSIESSDNNNVVKAKTAKAFYLNVLYKNQVPDNVFENDSFNDNVTMKLNLSSGNVENPNTGIKYFVFILFVITTMIVMFFIFKKKRKNNRFEFLIIGLVLLIPISVRALCNVDININSSIKIDKPIVCGSFENDSWSDISYNVKNGNDSCYNVGDTKEVEVDGYGTHTVRIANKSTPDECSNSEFSQTACGFVVEFGDVITRHFMNSSDSNIGGWENCNMRTYINSDIYNVLPIELKNVIIDTKVVSGHGSRSGESNFVTTDKLYLLSPMELWGYNYYSQYDTSRDFTRQMDYYLNLGVNENNHSAAEKIYNMSVDDWWLRSAYSTSTYSFHAVEYGGYYDDDVAQNGDGVSPAFRIG